MYFIEIKDTKTGKEWKEEFDSYYLFRKRLIKLSYSKTLKILSRSVVYEWEYKRNIKR